MEKPIKVQKLPGRIVAGIGADRGRAALNLYRNWIWQRGGATPSNPDESLEDLLTDIRHYCAARGISFEQAVAMSEQHFEAERGGASC